MNCERSALDRVLAAYDRTAAYGPARARFSYDTGFDQPNMASLLPAALREMVEAVSAHLTQTSAGFDLSRFVEEGIVDLAQASSAMLGPTGLRVIVRGRQWWGTPGDALVEAEGEPVNSVGHPLWLLGLLRGATRASEKAPELKDGAHRQVFAVSVDLRRASAAMPGGLAPCEVARVENLASLPITVLLDGDGRVVRVSSESIVGEHGNSAYAVELHDFFGDDEPVDWTRIPEVPRSRVPQ